jgi:SRSO17 transposase
MEERFEIRYWEMMGEAELNSLLMTGTRERLEEFVRPFAAVLTEPEQRQYAQEYVGGLLSKLKRKTGESIAYLYDQDRQGIQRFIGQVSWDHKPLLSELAKQVGETIGESDGVIVFDPSGFAKKGKKSVGVARQWCGRLGKVDNCQVATYMGYVGRQDHALVNFRLYLPKEWTGDRARCREAGVPRDVHFQTRHQQALDMLKEHGSLLPHRWVTGDDEMGRSSSFRGDLRELSEHYLLAVPSNTLVRDLEAELPAYSGRGRRPQQPFVRVDRWCAALPEAAWTRIDVRDGEKGPLVIEAVQRRVQAHAGRQVGPEETLFVTRERQADGSYKRDYYLAFAESGTSSTEFARVTKAEHRIEECIKRGKSEAGLAGYQVRNWMGWHHHQTLSLVAAWFLSEETRRGKNTDARAHESARCRHDRRPDGRVSALQHSTCYPTPEYPLDAAHRASPLLSPSCA